MERDRPEKQTVTLHVPKILFWLALIFFVLLPVGGFYFAVNVLGPVEHKARIAAMEQQMAQAKAETETLRGQMLDWKNLMDQARSETDVERNTKAELEAKITIAETARNESLLRLQQVEEEKAAVEKSLKFYESLLAPAGNHTVQCFNILASVNSGKVRYNVSFLKTDSRDKKPLSAEVRFSVLTGRDMRAAQDPKALLRANHKRSLNITTEAKLDGDFPFTGDATDPTRVLDVRAYDASGKVISQCWKGF
jgi:hypothetical protein